VILKLRTKYLNSTLLRHVMMLCMIEAYVRSVNDSLLIENMF